MILTSTANGRGPHFGGRECKTMSRHIGAGYGSEFHLMRYLARYRNRLNRRIEEKAGGRVIEWLDFVPGSIEEYSTRLPCRSKLPDHEIVGLDFLKKTRGYSEIVEAWRRYWPKRGNQQNWDAVAKMDIEGVEHWLLVEAKANIQEIRSHCRARDGSARNKIDDALREVRDAFGLKPSGNLRSKYYQYANRLAALYFLRQHNRHAKLLFIYFLSDKNPEKQESCPECKEDWRKVLSKQEEWLGLNSDKKNAIGIIDLFLNVVPTKR